MKYKLTCYIVDDEPLAQEILEEYIAKVSFLELKGSFGSPLEAAGQMEKDKPDLLFLDINMPDLDGLSFIPMLNPRPMVILTTAYEQHALKAYDLEVKDYLLKPISFERFYKGVLRLYQSVNQRPQPVKEDISSEQPQETEHIFLKVGTRIQKVAIRDIQLIEGMKDYLRIHTVKGTIVALLNFAALEELLPSHKFARVHKSYMVAIDKIEHIERSRIKIAEQTIPVSDTYKESFFRLLRGNIG
ncbi:LytR/AlgR family response regulator transcription factor [Telluribacter humicola]|uniref:LytR/AlgR family response regulator transcription factor n=1 Tax=Telluribacter humicola TaxID=1720261 RepID=UPI001A975677|nr:LytTR family DNA-binding domain-containing protein [Telluribacter humicola]